MPESLIHSDSESLRLIERDQMNYEVLILSIKKKKFPRLIVMEVLVVFMVVCFDL